jgi:DNA-binding winged helix-turn-helix (wHTH) protein
VNGVDTKYRKRRLWILGPAKIMVTKGELMAEVWPGIVVEENNIQVHVSALRKVLGKPGGAREYVR